MTTYQILYAIGAVLVMLAAVPKAITALYRSSEDKETAIEAVRFIGLAVAGGGLVLNFIQMV